MQGLRRCSYNNVIDGGDEREGTARQRALSAVFRTSGQLRRASSVMFPTGIGASVGAGVRSDSLHASVAFLQAARASEHVSNASATAVTFTGACVLTMVVFVAFRTTSVSLAINESEVSLAREASRAVHFLAARFEGSYGMLASSRRTADFGAAEDDAAGKAEAEMLAFCNALPELLALPTMVEFGTGCRALELDVPLRANILALRARASARVRFASVAFRSPSHSHSLRAHTALFRAQAAVGGFSGARVGGGAPRAWVQFVLLLPLWLAQVTLAPTLTEIGARVLFAPVAFAPAAVTFASVPLRGRALHGPSVQFPVRLVRFACEMFGACAQGCTCVALAR